MKKGWVVKRLSDVCAKITDGTHQTPTYFNEGVVFLSSKNVTSGFIDWENIKYIDKQQHLEMHKRVAPKMGDVLLAKNGTTGVAAKVDRNIVFDIYVSLALLRPLNDLNPDYLFYFINSPIAKSQFNKRLKGIGVPNLHLEEIREVEIPIPPLPEQKRIVAILDEAFSAIAKAKANAEQNLKNAKELFESYLQSVFENKGDDWEEKTLAEIVDNIITGPFGSMLHKSDYVEDGTPVVNPQNIVDGQILSLQKTMISDSTVKRLQKYLLKDNDIVIARRGEMGRCAIVNKNNTGWLCGTGCFVVRANIKKVECGYLNMLLSSESIKIQMQESSIGATMSNLNQTALMNLSLTIPPLSLQRVILHKINDIQNKAQKLELIYQQKISDLEELKKTILQKAFNGELNLDRVAV